MSLAFLDRVSIEETFYCVRYVALHRCRNGARNPREYHARRRVAWRGLRSAWYVIERGILAF